MKTSGGWEKIFANDATNKSLILQRYRQRIENSMENTSHLIEKWVGDLDRHFPKEDRQMPHTHMKRCLTSQLATEMQIKATLRELLTLVRTAITEEPTNNNRWGGCEEKGVVLHCWGNVSRCSHSGEQYRDSSKY